VFKPLAVIFLKKTLGEDGFEALNKFELYKRKTNTVVDPEEIRIGLQIVPRAILSFLQKELGSMKEGTNKDVQIPIEQEAVLSVTKFANDVYSGEIIQKGKVISSFKYRSLPGVGITLVSSFELYDLNDLYLIGRNSDDKDVMVSSPKSEERPTPLPDLENKIQNLIDEKMRLRDLVSKVVEDKLSQRQAIEEMVKLRLTQELEKMANLASREEVKQDVPNSLNIDKQKNNEVSKILGNKKGPEKLKEFLNKAADKKSRKIQISLEKSEVVRCPDCDQLLFDKSGFSGCICLGTDRNKKIHIKKTEAGGIELSFSKGWEPENIEMLLEVLQNRKKNKGGGHHE
jgi:hypothetical protein